MNTKQTEALKLALEALSPWAGEDANHTEQYAAYHAIREALAEQPAQQQELVAIEYWLQDTMESGRWVTTDNMAKATAEKILSGEYGDVYPQGRIVEPSPPASKPWVVLTDDEIEELANDFEEGYVFRYRRFTRAIEAKLKEKNA